MSKKKIAFIVILSVLVGLLADVFFGSSLAARLSTVRLFGKFQILKPQAPIVINTKEEVRASDSQDILNAVDKAKSKLSVVIFNQGSTVQVAGAAINVTSDGLFVTSKSAVANAKAAPISVLTNSGESFPVTQAYSDPASNLVALKTDAHGVSVADFGKSKELVSGERIAFLAGSLKPYTSRFVASFVSFLQDDTTGQIFDSDKPSRSFGVLSASNIIPGQAVINLNGEIVGIFDGSTVVSSDVLSQAVNNFATQKANLVRPAFGFHYRVVGPTESALLKLPLGAQIAKASDNLAAVNAGSPASQAGLLEGDVITSVNDTKIDPDNSLEELLAKFKPGDGLKLFVSRAGNTITLNLQAGTLK